MGESDAHRTEMMRHIELLTDYYEGQQVYVSGNLLVYYEQGNPRKYVVPDAFVVKGVAPGKRRIYKIWAEGKGPDVVIESTSRKTRRKDSQDKPRLYAQLRVAEYFLFDVDQEYLKPPLQGFRLAGGAYERIEADARDGLVSQELGLRLVIAEGVLQFYRLDTEERLLTRGERAQNEAKRADQEAGRREAAEAELARLREELARRDASRTQDQQE
jgi:Uma2 family endonuclease